MAGRIFVTGDCHRKFNKFSKAVFPIQTELDKNDYVIICGDFGGIWDREEESKEEKWWLNWLATRSFTTLFIDGNHENFDRLGKYPIREWQGGKVHVIRPSLLHLMRGQIYDLWGTRIFAFGGASSHDIQAGVLELDDPDFDKKKRKLNLEGECYRINHLNWWREEMASSEEMEEGLMNLARVGNQVDYIITHCGASSTQEELRKDFEEPDMLNIYFEKLKSRCRYPKWYMGHYHEDRNINDKEILLYQQIVEIGENVDENVPVPGHPRYEIRQPVKFMDDFGKHKEMIGLIGIRDAYGETDSSQPSYDIWSICNDKVCLFKHIPEKSVALLKQDEIKQNKETIDLIRADLGW